MKIFTCAMNSCMQNSYNCMKIFVSFATQISKIRHHFFLSQPKASFKMRKIMKQGKIVIVLSGRYAGRKAIIVKTDDVGSSDKPFGHALVAGIDSYPRKVTKKMGKNKLKKKAKVKPFLKVLNYNHLMSTRYTTHDITFEKLLSQDLKDPAKKKAQTFPDPRQIWVHLQGGPDQVVLPEVALLNTCSCFVYYFKFFYKTKMC